MKSTYKTNKAGIPIAVFLLVLGITGCKKLIDVNAPITSTNDANVYTNDATAAAVLTGIYTNISDLDVDLTNDNLTSMSLYPALSADELTLYNLGDPRLSPYYTNNLTSLTTSGYFWSKIYPIIFTTNAAIDGLNSSTSLTPAVKQQLLGEAQFMRAFCYFYLVNLYGDVPLVLNTDYKVNASSARVSKSSVYQQIISDLKDAQGLLSSNYLKSDAFTPYPTVSTAERVRPTKWAADALLARVYLYTGDYPNAEAQASAVINNSAMFSPDSLNGVFLKNSTSAIWSLQPVNTGTPVSNTGEGALFVLPPTGPNTYDYPVYLSNNVVNAFEPGDLRRAEWVDSVIAGGITYYYPYKYKIGKIPTTTQEYIMVLRLEEQYLIRAEARAQQGETNSVNDLNAIRNRAGLPDYSGGIDKTSLLTAILHERQVELFTEWGHRWFDLKRTNTIDAVMNAAATQKGGAWSPYKTLYPIPQDEINKDQNLVQNTGY